LLGSANGIAGVKESLDAAMSESPTSNVLAMQVVRRLVTIHRGIANSLRKRIRLRISKKASLPKKSLLADISIAKTECHDPHVRIQGNYLKRAI